MRGAAMSAAGMRCTSRNGPSSCYTTLGWDWFEGPVLQAWVVQMGFESIEKTAGVVCLFFFRERE